MKLKIDKKIEGGVYIVYVLVSEFSQDEQEQMKRFGPPWVSVHPNKVLFRRTSVDKIPIDVINHQFRFGEEDAANEFVEEMKNRIKEAMEALREKKDNFTKEEEYEF